MRPTVIVGRETLPKIPVRINIGSIVFFGMILVAIIWILAVTLIYWNMDPKFGGPYRWATFAMTDYWLVSFLPSTSLILLLIAIRHRWRLITSGGAAYRYLGDMSAPVIMMILISLVLTVSEGGNFRIELLERHHAWSDLQYAIFIPFVMLALLVFPIAVRAWFACAVVYLLLFLTGSLLVEWLTETTVTATEGGTRYSRNAPSWASLFFGRLKLASSIIFLVAGTQVLLHFTFWSSFNTFGKSREQTLE